MATSGRGSGVVGYYSSEEILACREARIAVTLPKPLTSDIEARGRFGKQNFVYISDEDVYRCPAGEKLKYRGARPETGALLDKCMPPLCAQASLHNRQGAADHALGA